MGYSCLSESCYSWLEVIQWEKVYLGDVKKYPPFITPRDPCTYGEVALNAGSIRLPHLLGFTLEVLVVFAR